MGKRQKIIKIIDKSICECFENFMKHCKVKKLSQQTLKTYERECNYFIEWYGEENLFCLDSGDDIEMRKVKVAKILEISSIITSAGNVAYVALADNISKVDIGGIGVSIIRLFQSEKVITDIKLEYIRQKFSELVDGKKQIELDDEREIVFDKL